MTISLKEVGAVAAVSIIVSLAGLVLYYDAQQDSPRWDASQAAEPELQPTTCRAYFYSLTGEEVKGELLYMTPKGEFIYRFPPHVRAYFPAVCKPTGTPYFP